jgi:pilus assembly protein CpaE
MKAHVPTVSILYGTGSTNPAYRELIRNLDTFRILKEATDPETFVIQHKDLAPDLVLVELNGSSEIPIWLEPMVSRLPRSQVLVCSESRNPDFLIRLFKLRVSGFIPLPLHREEFEAAVQQVWADLSQRQDVDQGHILAVIGTKGGVGTTSIATNLAVALADLMPGETVLVDLARPFPHVGQFLDLKSTHTIMDLVESAGNLDPVFIKKVIQPYRSNLGVLLNRSEFSAESDSQPNIQTMRTIFDTLRPCYTWVVVDMGNWLDSFTQQILQQADQILLVAELTLPDLQNLHIIESLFRRYDLDKSKVKVLVNRYVRDYTLGLKDLERISMQPVSCILPYEFPTMIEAMNQGMPLEEAAPRSKLWRKLKGFAAELETERAAIEGDQRAPKTGFFQKLFHHNRGKQSYGMVTE